MTMDETPLDPTSTQARKRFLPSVSEVVRLVAQRDPSADPAQVFKAARYVCSEELTRVKQGGAAAPAEELASRVQSILRQGYPPPAGARPPAAPAPPPPPPAAGFRPLSGTSDDPFSETTGALDLRWEPEAGEPFEAGEVAAPGGPPAPGGEPFELAAVPPPPPPPFLLDDAAREAEERAGALDRGEEAATGIPGEETLTRLEKEAAELPLSSVFPPSAAHAPTEPLPPLRFGGAAAAKPDREKEPAPEAPAPEEAPPRRPDWDRPFLPERVPFQPPEAPQRAPRLLVAGGSLVVLLAVAGVAWVYLGGGKLPSIPLLGGGAPKPTTSPVPYLPASAQTGAAPEPTATAVLVPTELPIPTPVAPAPTAVPAPTATVAPLALAARVPPAPTALAEMPSPVPVTRVAARPTEPAPETPAARPAPVRPAEGAGSLPRQNRPASLVSPDWAGKEPAFVLHFASYRDRALAEKDAQRLARAHGRPAFALEVDLGAKGTYFRSVLSGFASGEEALAFREELSAGGATGVGFVYRVTGK